MVKRLYDLYRRIKIVAHADNDNDESLDACKHEIAKLESKLSKLQMKCKILTDHDNYYVLLKDSLTKQFFKDLKESVNLCETCIRLGGPCCEHWTLNEKLKKHHIEDDTNEV